MTRMILKLAATAVLTAAAASSQAQPATTSVPNNVGVTQGTANEAATKAVPRSDTATLVRTAPNAADRTRAATDNTAAGMSPAPAAATSPAPVQRPRKADRN